MTQTRPILVSFLLFLFIAAPFSQITGARIVDQNGNPYTLHFDQQTTFSYVDQNTPINSQKAYIRVFSSDSASLAGKYVGATYRVGSGPYFIITDDNNGNGPLTTLQAVQSCGSGCFYADTSNSMFFSSYTVPATSGTPGSSIYPSNIQAVVSPSENANDPGALFLPVAPANGSLAGTYSVSRTANYNQLTGAVSYSVTGAADGSSNILSIRTANGFPNYNYLSAGVCGDSYGVNCFDSKSAVWGASQSYSTGILRGNASIPVTVYFVVNGVSSNSFCIGPTLTSSVSITGDACPLVLACGSTRPSCPSGGIVRGSTVNISATTTNGGNVDATPYSMILVVTNSTGGVVVNQTFAMGNLSAGTSQTQAVQYTLPPDYTGGLTATVTTDSGNDVAECSESGHVSSTSKTVYFGSGLKLYIDGALTTTFGQIYRPYNVSIAFTDENNAPYDHGRVEFIEQNGLSVNAPMQVWQADGNRTGLSSQSIATAYTNSQGLVNFTYVPTGNRYYQDFANLSDYVGNYSLYANGYSPSGTCVITLPLNISSMQQQPVTAPNSLSVYNQNYMVQGIYDMIYTAYSQVHGWLAPAQ
ncbi:MAG: CARDB domain-containing protein [Candidatus Micrarchaeia archaeon]